MPNYRRALIAGATCFFTVVTANRRPLFASAAAVQALRTCVLRVRAAMPFHIDAWVVLPDHMHAIWTLPPDDEDFSRRWERIKATFTQRCELPHASAKGRYAGIWQPRFWEHVIRSERDLGAHMDYVHYNPVKHGHAIRVTDWPYSTFHHLVREGVYPADWGTRAPTAPPSINDV